MNTKPTTHKFVAVLNKKIPIGQLMNALGHMSAGFAASYPAAADLRLQDYIDKDGGKHPAISDNPYIVLAADNSNKIRAFRQALIENGLRFSDFTNTMTEGTYIEQHQRTNTTLESDLEYFGIVTFGPSSQLNNLTRKFSLWRS